MSKLFEEFQEFRKILCLCPCCGDLVRVSDLKLKIKGLVKKTWLDDYQNRAMLLEKKEERFDEQEEKLREIAREKGRKAAQVIFNKAITPAFKALKFDPFDVKPILHPVDFVVFKGMNKNDDVKDIVFLSRIRKSPLLNNVRQKVNDIIQDKRYDWQVARIDEQGRIEIE